MVQRFLALIVIIANHEVIKTNHGILVLCFRDNSGYFDLICYFVVTYWCYFGLSMQDCVFLAQCVPGPEDRAK